MGDEAFKRETQVKRPTNPDKGRIKSLGLRYLLPAAAVSSVLAFGSAGCATLTCDRYLVPDLGHHHVLKEGVADLGQCQDGLRRFTNLIGKEGLKKQIAIEDFVLSAERNPEFIIPYLLRLSEDGDPITKSSVAEIFGLAKLDRSSFARYDDVIYRLEGMLFEADTKVAERAAIALGRIAERADISGYDGLFDDLAKIATAKEYSDSKNDAAVALLRMAEKNPDVVLPRLEEILASAANPQHSGPQGRNSYYIWYELGPSVSRKPEVFLPFLANLLEKKGLEKDAYEAIRSGCSKARSTADPVPTLLELLENGNNSVKLASLAGLLGVTRFYVFEESEFDAFMSGRTFLNTEVHLGIDVGKYSGAIEKIAKCLKNESPEVRRSAAELLAQIADDRNIERPSISGGFYRKGYRGADLSKHPGLIEDLGKLLLDPDPRVKVAAAGALSSVSSKTDLSGNRPIILRLETLLSDESSLVRYAAVEALGYISEKAGLAKYPSITEKLRSMNYQKEASSVQEMENNRIVLSSFFKISRTDPQEILPFLEGIVKEKWGESLTWGATEPLSQAVAYNPEVLFKPISLFLADADGKAQHNAERILQLATEKNPEGFTKHLATLLADKNPVVRAHGANIIGEAISKKNNRDLYVAPNIVEKNAILADRLEELFKDKDKAVVEKAVFAVGEAISRNPDHFLPRIYAAFKCESKIRSSNASSALGRAIAKNPYHLVPRLKAPLSDSNPMMREGTLLAIRFAVEKKHLPEFVGSLIPLLSDQDAKVRSDAAIALGIMGSTCYVERQPCSPSYSVPRSCLAQLDIDVAGNGIIKALSLSLEDADAGVKKEALNALAEIASKKHENLQGKKWYNVDFGAYKGLADRIKSLCKDEDPEIRAAAENALRLIKKNISKRP